MPQELPLEPDLIEVLASDTRREILSHLRNRRMTVTELSKALDLQKATVHEHLKKLVNVGLIEREEDERVWVYYRLTPRGKRLLNPKRTRFYLAIGFGLLAAILVVAAASFYITSGPSGMIGPEPAPEGETDDAFHVAADDSPGEFTLYVADSVRIATDAEPGTEAYLVESDLEPHVREGAPSVEGWPLHQEPDTRASAENDEAFTASEDADDRLSSSEGLGPTIFTSKETVPAGTYHVFLRNEHDDNREQMPTVHVETVTVSTSHDPWWKGISEDLIISIDAENHTVEGTLLLEPDRPGAPTIAAPLTNGEARLEPERLDALPPGSYGILLGTDGANRFPVGTVELRDPTITVSPQIVPPGTETQVNVTVYGNGEPLESTVRASGEPLREPSTGQAHEALSMEPERPGLIMLEVGRQASVTVTAHSAVQGTLATEQGPEHILTLEHPNGTLAGDIAVRLNGSGVGFTKPDGTLSLDRLPEGTHTLSMEGDRNGRIEQTIRVDGWDVEMIRPRIDIGGIQGQAPGGLEFEIRETAGARAQGTLMVSLDGIPVHAASYDIGPGQDERRSVPIAPSSHGEHTVSVVADAFNPASLLVENRTDEADGRSASGQASQADRVVQEAVIGEPVSEVGDALVEEPEAAQGSGPEPIFPSSQVGREDAIRADEATETPGLAPIAVLLTVILAALRRPR